MGLSWEVEKPPLTTSLARLGWYARRLETFFVARAGAGEDWTDGLSRDLRAACSYQASKRETERQTDRQTDRLGEGRRAEGTGKFPTSETERAEAGATRCLGWDVQDTTGQGRAGGRRG